ncbi:phosphatidylinositol-4-phosphate 5-kinase [Capsaspora owczarzaki ATCC 30864]|uniref:Phosphatidylinositol-4-phosphate 5-kinase n=1 Tax=Capsaspora owczarzaki (strain ATCC 30864) TaxID=595528 RepID=A0A0D2VLH8_CAPO3|nr:phosphatidylinositol-4-phosphate 5-kinase [Capsaspora owczarzaki ATCC 30864]KJE90972.1 phosphatidylinositol-4-phosphate 5-kinase [Capsaspora owczarzaki ATCC 30864]|eukprot:XP_004348939.1 phosphatidylinositol-4-phosphate 5-kinase [Capsaspora owczarzaki ATCC 30864]
METGLAQSASAPVVAAADASVVPSATATLHVPLSLAPIATGVGSTASTASFASTNSSPPASPTGGISDKRRYSSNSSSNKLGHRKVVDGEVVYKKTPSSDLMQGIQLGIRHSVGSITPKQSRDLLMIDFEEHEIVDFPSEGGTYTPAHSSNSFRFKSYAPRAFRHFREAFGIKAEDFMLSLCNEPLRELSNPGASGSLFYMSHNDHFIIKTVQRREALFLRQLLPGYYMNLTQNKKTLLPKFFGLYCYKSALGFNIRFVVMNNLLPSIFRYHERYDLKGSTHARMASQKECMKSDPTFKDLDFMNKHPEGIYLPPSTYEALMRAMQRDCLVLRSFKIMDYSLLVGLHKLDETELQRNSMDSQTSMPDVTPPPTHANSFDLMSSPDKPQSFFSSPRASASVSKEEKNESLRRAVLYKKLSEIAAVTGTPLNVLNKKFQKQVSYVADISETLDLDPELETYAGGMLAYTDKKERCIIFLGIIDILQQYQLKKRLEHSFKALLYDGEAVSVTNPSFYAARFQDFFAKRVFKVMGMEMLKELMPAIAVSIEDPAKRHSTASDEGTLAVVPGAGVGGSSSARSASPARGKGMARQSSQQHDEPTTPRPSARSSESSRIRSGSVTSSSLLVQITPKESSAGTTKDAPSKKDDKPEPNGSPSSTTSGVPLAAPASNDSIKMAAAHSEQQAEEAGSASNNQTSIVTPPTPVAGNAAPLPETTSAPEAPTSGDTGDAENTAV